MLWNRLRFMDVITHLDSVMEISKIEVSFILGRYDKHMIYIKSFSCSKGWSVIV